LKQGYGETVCLVLNSLADYVLDKKGFKFQKPVYPEGGGEEDMDNEEEEESMVADETIVDDGESEDALNDMADEASTPRTEE
jgi:hypothetical protein